jgi:hypothetical protein
LFRAGGERSRSAGTCEEGLNTILIETFSRKSKVVKKQVAAYFVAHVRKTRFARMFIDFEHLVSAIQQPSKH